MHTIPIADAHVHFWNLEKHCYPWLEPAEPSGPFGKTAAIRKTYLLKNYLADASLQSVTRMVHVEAGWDQQAQKFAALSPGYYPRAMELSGLVLGSPLLSLHDRQIMTVAMLACLGGQSDQLLFHMGVALRNGVSQTALSGILLLVQAYAGMPRANSAASLALDALAQDQQASLS